MQKRVKCPVCGHSYQSSQVAILGMQGEDYLIRCICTCGAIATFLFSQEKATDPPVTVDDVLIAHEFLKEYNGNADGLFAKALPPGDPT